MSHHDLPNPIEREIDTLIERVASNLDGSGLNEAEQVTHQEVTSSKILDKFRDSHIDIYNTLKQYKYIDYPELDTDQQDLLIRRQVKQILLDYIKRHSHKEYRRREAQKRQNLLE